MCIITVIMVYNCLFNHKQSLEKIFLDNIQGQIIRYIYIQILLSVLLKYISKDKIMVFF